MKVIASWSGGKDSCFACYRAVTQGHQVTHLVNFISRGVQAGLLPWDQGLPGLLSGKGCQYPPVSAHRAPRYVSL